MGHFLELNYYKKSGNLDLDVLQNNKKNFVSSYEGQGQLVNNRIDLNRSAIEGMAETYRIYMLADPEINYFALSRPPIAEKGELLSRALSGLDKFYSKDENKKFLKGFNKNNSLIYKTK